MRQPLLVVAQARSDEVFHKDGPLEADENLSHSRFDYRWVAEHEGSYPKLRAKEICDRDGPAANRGHQKVGAMRLPAPGVHSSASQGTRRPNVANRSSFKACIGTWSTRCAPGCVHRNGGRLVHGTASLPRSTAVSSQNNCNQPPLRDGLGACPISWLLPSP
jgi:hypothetical protein